MTVKHTPVSSDMRVFALCSLMELHRSEQIRVYWFRRVTVSVDIDEPAPICPLLSQRREWEKPAGVHIVKAISCFNISEITLETLSVISKAGGCGKAGTCADQHSVCLA